MTRSVTSKAFRSGGRLIIACSALAVVAHVAHGQAMGRLQLRVIDSVTGAPVSGAEVRMAATKDTAEWTARVVTDSAGRASVPAVAGEHVLLSARRLGFVASVVRIGPAQKDDSLVVALAPSGLSLAPSVTRAMAANRRLALTGFYERRRIGIGTFLDSAAIANRQPLDLLSLLRPYLKGCTMIYIDGLRMLGLRDVDVMNVTGIEIYAGNVEAPPQFQNPLEGQKRCGSVVIWRRI